MKRYRCIKSLVVDNYDEDGYPDEKSFEVKVGDIYECDEGCQDLLMIADKPAIHLSRVHEHIYEWVELYPEDIAEHFEELSE